MRELEEARGRQLHRGNVSKELRGIAERALEDAELESLTLYRLMKAFERVMEKFEYEHPDAVHQIIQFSYTIEDQQLHILAQVRQKQQAGFKSIFGACRNRIHAIVTFLAMLELINMQRVAIIAGGGTNNFWLKEIEDTPEDHT